MKTIAECKKIVEGLGCEGHTCGGPSSWGWTIAFTEDEAINTFRCFSTKRKAWNDIAEFTQKWIKKQ